MPIRVSEEDADQDFDDHLFSQRKLLPKLLGALDMSMILNIFSWIKYLDARTRAIKLQTTFSSVTGGCAIV